jgi:hypothetical protein
MMRQRPSWQSWAVMEELQAIQLAWLSSEMVVALTDMVDQCHDECGERESGDGDAGANDGP